HPGLQRGLPGAHRGRGRRAPEGPPLSATAPRTGERRNHDGRGRPCAVRERALRNRLRRARARDHPPDARPLALQPAQSRGAGVVYGVNVLGYTAALAAYRDGEPWLEELLRYLGANRDFLVDYVRRRLAGVAVAPPDATYLAWLDCRDAAIPGGDPFTFFLETARVALNDGTAFGRSGQGFVRLNFG